MATKKSGETEVRWREILERQAGSQLSIRGLPFAPNRRPQESNDCLMNLFCRRDRDRKGSLNHIGVALAALVGGGKASREVACRRQGNLATASCPCTKPKIRNSAY